MGNNFYISSLFYELVYSYRDFICFRTSPFVEFSLSRITPLIKGLEKLKEIAMAQGLYNTSLDQTIQEKAYPEHDIIRPTDGQQTSLPLK